MKYIECIFCKEYLFNHVPSDTECYWGYCEFCKVYQYFNNDCSLKSYNYFVEDYDIVVSFNRNKTQVYKELEEIINMDYPIFLAPINFKQKLPLLLTFS